MFLWNNKYFKGFKSEHGVYNFNQLAIGTLTLTKQLIHFVPIITILLYLLFWLNSELQVISVKTMVRKMSLSLINKMGVFFFNIWMRSITVTADIKTNHSSSHSSSKPQHSKHNSTKDEWNLYFLAWSRHRNVFQPFYAIINI